MTKTNTEDQTIINDQIIIRLYSNSKYDYWFGHCVFCFDEIKKSIDSINVYLYNNTCGNTYHVIEHPLSLSIGDLMKVFNNIGVLTDSVGNFKNEYSGCRDIEDNDSHKISYSIADLIDTIYCSLPDNYDKERMLFLYRSYFDIILKRLIPGYYIVDPISNVQAIPIEANDMVRQIDRMFKRIQYLSMVLGITGTLLSISIFIIWIISYLS